MVHKGNVQCLSVVTIIKFQQQLSLQVYVSFMEFECTDQVVCAELKFKKKKVKKLKRKLNDERKKVGVYNFQSTKCNFSVFFTILVFLYVLTFCKLLRL